MYYMIVVDHWKMNNAHCSKLKKNAILDVSIITIGLVMRVLMGCLTADILILMTFLLSLFLVLIESSHEFSIFEYTGIKP